MHDGVNLDVLNNRVHDIKHSGMCLDIVDNFGQRGLDISVAASGV